MPALVYTEPSVLEVQDIEEPLPQADELLITVALAGLGGSEVLAFRNPGIRALPLVMGHGVVGRTPDGRRVAVNPLTGCGTCPQCAMGLPQRCTTWRMLGVHHNGGLAERVAVPARALIHIPETMPWERAVFIEPFANALRAWERSGATTAHNIAVIGAGGLGLGCIAAAHQAGLRNIACSEPSLERITAATTLGATETQLTGPYDIVFDTVGSAETRALAIQHTRPGGTIVLLGFADTTPGFDPIAFIRAELHLTGSFVFTEDQFRRAIPLAQRAEPAWVEVLTLEEAPKALKAFGKGDYTTVKAAVDPSRALRSQAQYPLPRAQTPELCRSLLLSL